MNEKFDWLISRQFFFSPLDTRAKSLKNRMISNSTKNLMVVSVLQSLKLCSKFELNTFSCVKQNHLFSVFQCIKMKTLLSPKKFRQINCLVKTLLTRNICQISVRVNFRNFHTVCLILQLWAWRHFSIRCVGAKRKKKEGSALWWH